MAYHSTTTSYVFQQAALVVACRTAVSLPQGLQAKEYYVLHPGHAVCSTATARIS